MGSYPPQEYTREELYKFFEEYSHILDNPNTSIYRSNLTISNGHSWDYYREAVKLLARVKFPCNIDSICGSCCASKEQPKEWFESKPKLCCAICYLYRGFNLKLEGKTHQERMEKVDKQIPFWTKEHGFWQEGIGCKLPRELRSCTCNSYLCPIALKEIERRKWKYLKLLLWDISGQEIGKERRIKRDPNVKIDQPLYVKYIYDPKTKTLLRFHKDENVIVSFPSFVKKVLNWKFDGFWGNYPQLDLKKLEQKLIEEGSIR